MWYGKCNDIIIKATKVFQLTCFPESLFHLIRNFIDLVYQWIKCLDTWQITMKSVDFFSNVYENPLVIWEYMTDTEPFVVSSCVV
jgi:hypothetical protein